MEILEVLLALVIVTLLFVLFWWGKIRSIELEWPNSAWPLIRITGAEVESEIKVLYNDMMRSVEDFRNHMRGDRPKYDREIVQTILEADS